MTEPEDLAAEYRAFVRQLHKQTIGIVAEVSRYWLQELSPKIVEFTSGVFDQEDDEAEAERSEIADRAGKLQHRLQNEIEPRLNILAYGHPDPDVRRAADVFVGRLNGVLLYHNFIRAKRKEGKSASTAVNLAHSGLRDLRRAAYHAPFRIDRPEPEYDGVGVVEPLASELTDIPEREY